MANEEDEGIEEYVNVIIFGGIYGIMMVNIILQNEHFLHYIINTCTPP